MNAKNKKSKAKLKPKKKFLRLLVFGGFCVIVSAVFLNIVITSFADISAKYKEKEELSKELVDLKEKEQKLSLDVEKLQDPEYVGRYLREKYLYSKSSEYIIRLPNN